MRNRPHRGQKNLAAETQRAAGVKARALLEELPARTLSRRVGCIVQKESPADVKLRANILEIAQSLHEKRTGTCDWSLGEAIRLERSLEACESRLDKWLETQALPFLLQRQAN